VPKIKSTTPIATLWNGKVVRGTRYAAATDTRANKCYRWEWANKETFPLATTLVSRDVAKGLARLMAKVALAKLTTKLELTTGQVEFIRADFHSAFTKETNKFCFGGLGGVYFAAWGWTPWLISHEVAHWIDHWERELTTEKRTGHSPEWLGWHAFLLQDVAKVDYTKLRASLAKAGLRFVLP